MNVNLSILVKFKGKDFLIAMRKTEKIKTILYVTELNVPHKIEENCYEYKLTKI
jgi:hypothetical protein